MMKGAAKMMAICVIVMAAAITPDTSPTVRSSRVSMMLYALRFETEDVA